MSYRILVGAPSSGWVHDRAAEASYLATLQHEGSREPSCCGNLNINNVWCSALNKCMRGEYTHFAMVHADVHIFENEPGTRWLDRLIEEMDEVKADFMSVPMAIKDTRGLTTCGIGNPNNRWVPWRRFTVKEIDDLPKTFCADDIGYGDKFLIHNEAVALWDMRNPQWYIPNKDGKCRFNFQIDDEIVLSRNADPASPAFVRQQETEDWMFSRQLWEAGMRTYITKRIVCGHMGGMEYLNQGGWGNYQTDEDTINQWKGDKITFPHKPVWPSFTAAMRKTKPSCPATA